MLATARASQAGHHPSALRVVSQGAIATRNLDHASDAQNRFVHYWAMTGFTARQSDCAVTSPAQQSTADTPAADGTRSSSSPPPLLGAPSGPNPSNPNAFNLAVATIGADLATGALRRLAATGRQPRIDDLVSAAPCPHPPADTRRAAATYAAAV